jgi:hypothetical protein
VPQTSQTEPHLCCLRPVAHASSLVLCMLQAGFLSRPTGRFMTFPSQWESNAFSVGDFKAFWQMMRRGEDSSGRLSPMLFWVSPTSRPWFSQDIVIDSLFRHRGTGLHSELAGLPFQFRLRAPLYLQAQAGAREAGSTRGLPLTLGADVIRQRWHGLVCSQPHDPAEGR